MRDPALHITRSALKDILDRLPVAMTTTEQAEWIIQQSKDVELSYRMQPKLSKKMYDKVVNQRTSVDVDYVATFNGIYSIQCKELGNMGVDLINAYHKQYDLLKDVTKLAYEFLATFKIEDVNEGLKDYCKIGFELMNKKYALNKFKYYNSKINERYRYHELLAQDDNKAATKRFVDLWKAAMKHFGADVGLVTLGPDKRASFMFARQEADLLKSDYRDWIQAQFEGLAFLNSLPEISQLHGEQAAFRYKKFMGDKGVEGRTTKEENGTMTKEHREYLKKIKA